MNARAVANTRTLLGPLLVVLLAACDLAAADNAALAFPDPQLDAPLTPAAGKQTAVFAGGCFWGVESVFEHVKGVQAVQSGYAGGTPRTADYETVSSGSTGHAESVQVRFDPSKISYGQLLKVFFTAAHDPTQLNRQGPDRGTQYRSAIFYTSDEQQRIATAYIAQLQTAKLYPRPIVTQVNALKTFYPAESYHQDYARRHPRDPYIVINDAPKVAHLKQWFPALYVAD